MIDGIRDNNDTFFPPLLCKVITIPSAQVLTLLGTPVTLIPAIAGSAIIPEQMLLVKQASTIAYTIAGMTALVGGWTTGGALFWSNLVAAGFVGSLDVTTVQATLTARNVNSNYAFSFNTIINTAVTLAVTGANFAAGNADFKIWLKFRVWPNSNLGWF